MIVWNAEWKEMILVSVSAAMKQLCSVTPKLISRQMYVNQYVHKYTAVEVSDSAF